MFNTNYKKNKVYQGEKNFEKTKTVQSGWMPIALQVKRMEAAGMRLQAYKEAVYDFKFKVPVPDDANDPTRRKGYDMLDAWEDRQGALKRLKENARLSAEDAANIVGDTLKVSVKSEPEPEPEAEA